MSFTDVTCSCGHTFSADVSRGFCFCEKCGKRLEPFSGGADAYAQSSAGAVMGSDASAPAESTAAEVQPEEAPIVFEDEPFVDAPPVPEPAPIETEQEVFVPSESEVEAPAAAEPAPADFIGEPEAPATPAQEPYAAIPPVPVQPDYAPPAVPEQPAPPPTPVDYPVPVPTPAAQPVMQPAPQPVMQPVPQPAPAAPQGYPAAPAQPSAYYAPQGGMPMNPFGFAPVEPKADLQLAVQCLNGGNLKAAGECLELLKTSEPDNADVWFTLCRLLAAEKPLNVQTALTSFISYAEKCLALNENYRGNLTVEFNHFLNNMVNAVSADRLYIAPYDSMQLSEQAPSVRYQPFGYVDAYYSMIMSTIDGFRQKINPTYRNDYFLSIWDKAYFTFAHVIVQKLVTDVNASQAFYWYKVNLKNRTPDDMPLRALCEVIYGYKASFINAFNRTPYRDAKTLAVNRIVYLNSWLLKMKYLNQNGTFSLLVANPAQRAELDRESRFYRQRLAQS